jgi:alpha-tubulin suppressor-like RCC1 family protein
MMKNLVLEVKKRMKLTAAIVAAISLLLFFQNCGDVRVESMPSAPPPPQEPQAVKNINGTVCHSVAAASDTTYRLSNFYILNLTAHKFNGQLKADNNLDGMIDLDAVDSGGQTVTVSDTDDDEDSIPDFIEKLKGLNPTAPDAEKDGVDLDGVINRRELQLGTDPAFNGDEPSIDYTIEPAAAVSSCGDGQPAYKFVINSMLLTPNRAFSDAVNPEMYSLSHKSGENVLMVLVKLSPDDIRKPSRYITKIFKIDIGNPTTPEFKPEDFLILGEVVDECPTCLTGVTGNIYKKVYAGKKHTCALSTQNSPVCWGENGYGQLGDATNAARVAPVKPKLTSTVTSMALGEDFSCAITINSEVYCWGANNFGQLGVNSQVDSNVPVKVNLGTTLAPVHIMAGAAHACVVLENNTIKCWGKNTENQLGSGSTAATSLIPVNATMPAYGLSFPIVHVSAAGSTTCITGTGGTSFCWGKTSSCSVPLMSRVPVTCSGTTQTFPSQGINLTYAWSAMETNGVAQSGIEKGDVARLTCWSTTIFSAGIWGLGCGNQADGGVQERDDQGRLVGYSTEFTNVVSRVLKVKMGPNHSCAIWNKVSGSTVKRQLDCWGDNTFGALAQPVTSSNIKENPTTVSEVVEPVDVASGDGYSCAIDKDGVVWCWGLNSQGQLGTGDIANTSVPTKVKNQ